MSSATKLFKIRIQTTLPRTASRKDASCPPKVTAGKALAHERCCWRRNAGLVRETQRNVPRQSCPAYCAEHLCRGPCLRYRDNFASAQQRRAWPRQAEVLSRSGARGYSGAFLSSDKKTSGVVCCAPPAPAHLAVKTPPYERYACPCVCVCGVRGSGTRCSSLFSWFSQRQYD